MKHDETELDQVVQKGPLSHKTSASVSIRRNGRPSANEISTHVCEASEANGSPTSEETYCYRSNGNCASRKPMSQSVNKRKQLIWTRKYQTRAVDQWKRVFWIDASKFEIFRS